MHFQICAFSIYPAPVHTASYLYKNGGKNFHFCRLWLFILFRFCQISQRNGGLNINFTQNLIATNSLNWKTRNIWYFSSHRFRFLKIQRWIWQAMRILFVGDGVALLLYPFFAFTLIHSVFKSIHFSKYPLWLAFSKTSLLVRFVWSNMNGFTKRTFLSVFV